MNYQDIKKSYDRWVALWENTQLATQANYEWETDMGVRIVMLLLNPRLATEDNYANETSPEVREVMNRINDTLLGQANRMMVEINKIKSEIFQRVEPILDFLSKILDKIK